MRTPSLSVRKVAFTVYPIVDAPRARAFYEGLLGLTPGMVGGTSAEQGGMHWIEYDLPGGGCIALSNAVQSTPSADAGGTIALEVTDLSAMMAHLKGAGVPFKTDVIRGPHCQMAVCIDPEGNALLLHQLDA